MTLGSDDVMTSDDQWLEDYTERLSAHGRAVRNDRRLVDPLATVRRRSPVCGSTVEVDLDREGEVITAIGYAVRACALGQAGMSIIAAGICGHTIDEARQLRNAVHRMLAADKADNEVDSDKRWLIEWPPLSPELWPDPWKDIELLKPARDLRSRHGSVMLPFDAVIDAIDLSETASPVARSGEERQSDEKR